MFWTGVILPQDLDELWRPLPAGRLHDGVIFTVLPPSRPLASRSRAWQQTGAGLGLYLTKTNCLQLQKMWKEKANLQNQLTDLEERREAMTSHLKNVRQEFNFTQVNGRCCWIRPAGWKSSLVSFVCFVQITVTVCERSRNPIVQDLARKLGRPHLRCLV